MHDPKALHKAQMAEQKQMQDNYLKASIEDKVNGTFFHKLPLEDLVDHEAIAYAKKAGITDESLLSGTMSNGLIQKMNYMKSKHRSGLLL